MEPKRIVVTGANGQLGKELQAIAGSGTYPYDFIFTDIVELDITDREAVQRYFESEEGPDWIINTAAYTAVDQAETDVQTARRINVEGVKHLLEAAEKAGSRFIHISTDYVFDGTADQPLTETDPVNPQSVYGQTKLDGERAALGNSRSLVVRTSWLYSAHGNNFVKTMRRLGAEKQEISVVDDQWGRPTYAADLAEAILQMIGQIDETPKFQQAPPFGLYHYADRGETTWAGFAEEIMKNSGLDCQIRKISTSEYPTAAQRPPYSVLSTEKTERAFGLSIPHWKDSLKRCISLLESEERLVSL